MKLSLKTARRLAIYSQGLDGSWTLPAGKEGVAQVIERLGYVQIDTIHVIQRAHHHVLWARCPDYDSQMLHELQAEDRRVFEWWTHAASFVPMQDFRFYAVRMERNRRGKGWAEEHPEVMERVLARIREEGALGTSDFKKPEDFEQRSWWGWKPAKRALETHFNQGVLMISERRRFERIYDLRERVLPPGADVPVPTEAEMQQFIIRRALGGLGIAPAKHIRWWRQQPEAEALEQAVAAGVVTPVEMEGHDDEPWYAWTAALQAVQEAPEPAERRLHILSPFDNLTIRRYWLEELFNFDYRLEAYTPKAKRVYGYFSLPILWGTEFVGRIDTKADRKPQTLIVRHLVLEPGFAPDEAFWAALGAKLRAFAAFNGCTSFAIEQVTPAQYEAALVRALA